jgi:hypothetical protein
MFGRGIEASRLTGRDSMRASAVVVLLVIWRGLVGYGIRWVWQTGFLQ